MNSFYDVDKHTIHLTSLEYIDFPNFFLNSFTVLRAIFHEHLFYYLLVANKHFCLCELWLNIRFMRKVYAQATNECFLYINRTEHSRESQASGMGLLPAIRRLTRAALLVHLFAKLPQQCVPTSRG